MSEMNTQLPDLDSAFNCIAANVDYECFMNKLASLGFAPANEEEAQAAYELGWKLEQASNSPSVKSASAGPFAQASKDLDRVLENHGITKSAQDDELMQQAYAYAMRPEIYLSTLAIKTAEAEAAVEK